MRKSKRLSWLLAVIFVFTTMLGAVPSQAVAADLSDISNHWAKSQIESLINKGVVTGYPDNTFKPDNTITRAEFITMTNKAYSFTATATINYTDVPASAWYATEIAKAKAAGYIAGYEDGTMRPNAQITRQEAAKIISSILKLDISSDSALNAFTDAASIPAWSRGYVAAMVKAGYITGYPDGTFKAGNAINRAEAAVILGRVIGATPVVQKEFTKAGTYGPASGTQTIDGDVVVSADGVTLQNTIVKGNLLVAASVGEGSVTFKNVTVSGTTTVKGGGVNSVTFDNCKVNLVIVNKPASPVRVVFLNNSTAAKLQLDSTATIVGGGVTQAVINASGVVFDTAPGSYTLKSGISASIAGKTVTGTTGGGGGGGGGSPTPVAVTGVTLNTHALALKVGQTSTLTATIAPANATNQNVTWISDHPGAANVVNGVVTAYGKGTATITVTSVDGSFTDTCTVTVTVPVSGVSLSKSSLNMLVGPGSTNATLIPVISPADADDKAVTWESIDPTVATVDASGVVTPVAEGTTAITVTTHDGAKVASCTVTVGTANVAVTDVNLNYSTYTMDVGDDLLLVPFVSPADATDTNVSWNTDAAGVATVDNGTVTAVAPGTAHITVTTDDGSFTDSCTITVLTPVSGINLDKTSISNVAVGDPDVNLTATIAPAAADNKQVVWTTSNPAIATFIESAPGALTGIVRFIGGPGVATITATTVDGGYAASCIVNVGVRVSSVTLSPTTGTLKVGGSPLTLTATASPANATDKSVSWGTSNAALATVAAGVVSPVAAGTVTITATPVFKTGTATNGTATIDIFNVTKGIMIKDDTLLAGKTVVSVPFTIDGPALPLSSIKVTLNDGTVLQYHSKAGSTYVYTGSTSTAKASVNSANVSIRNAVSFSLTF